ncbi:MAG: PEP/pyruvate-binding domain-containing protein [Candidatus Thermoplasmatota archaeon]|nr:PEP/pyruvate-binding domain-containing protein [Candidatus Thermoplasmatota archaeon]
MVDKDTPAGSRKELAPEGVRFSMQTPLGSATPSPNMATGEDAFPMHPEGNVPRMQVNFNSPEQRGHRNAVDPSNLSDGNLASKVGKTDSSLTWDFRYEDYEKFFHSYHNLMSFKIQNILLVSSPYDAFILNEDGRLSEQIIEEYLELGLSSAPRLYSVPSGKRALLELKKRKYDLVITMSQIFDINPAEFGRRAKKLRPGVPVVLLATDNITVANYQVPGDHSSFDKVFQWLGDSALFLAIIKYFEDIGNVDKDTKGANVRVIVVVEDSARYYSSFLPIIYKEVMRQTKALVSEGLNEHEKRIRRRRRPKILLAETFKEALREYKKYHKYILGIITDISFQRNGKRCIDAGFKFAEKLDKNIPVLFQSSDEKHSERARVMQRPFLNKNSRTLLRDLSDFLTKELGFGDFIFRMHDATEIGRAADLKELVKLIREVPAESLRFHEKRFQFSRWLFARGELDLATKIRKKKFSDFESVDEVRDFLINGIEKTRKKRQTGIITDFSQQSFEFERSFTRFGRGSLGGKGRGIAFLSAMLRMSKINKILPEFNIRIPDTLVITTEEFTLFVGENGLDEIVHLDISDRDMAHRFVSGSLRDELRKALLRYLEHVKVPLAVRSSSLLEDSLHQPFAGIYSTYLLPNNSENIEERMELLCSAIKLVYASTYFHDAKTYIESTSQKVEEEKMGVVIQKLVGDVHGDRFHPLFSGAGVSRNYYPLPPLKRDSGIASVAIGLGKMVVDGGKVLSFSPENPRIFPGFSTTGEILQNSQRQFYCVDLARRDFDLTEGEDATLRIVNISDAKKDGILDLTASVYNPNDDIIRDGPYHEGHKVITFAGILKYERYPLANILRNLLEIGSRSLGGSVEIEFAVSNGRDDQLEFHILQIRPIISNKEKSLVMIKGVEDNEGVIVYSDKAMGNGLIDDISDIVMVLPSEMDRNQTQLIAHEIGEINSTMKKGSYLLLGPGRWGSFDRWLGIPVKWGQISRVGAIVEAPMLDIDVTQSQGSHFFHNISALGIPYLSVSSRSTEDRIDWEWLGKLKFEKKGRFVRHAHLEKPLIIKVNGKEGKGIVLIKEESNSS